MRTLVLILLVGGISACGTLRVQVDVADPSYIMSEVSDETIRKSYRQIVNSQPGEFSSQLDRNFAAYQAEVVALSKQYKNLANSFTDAEKSILILSADDLVAAVSKGSIFEEKELVGTELEKQAQEIRKLGQGARWNGRGVIPLQIREAVLTFQATHKELAVLQQRDIREIAATARDLAKKVATSGTVAGTGGPTTAPSALNDEVARQESRAQMAAQRSIIQGAELSQTEYAHVVASTSEELWQPRYNEAYGRGTMGNVDVVIRMNSIADFSVKGMRFDASTVAQVASKVMTQSLLLGAQMAGVPVGTSNSSGADSPGNALATQSSELGEIERAIVQREAAIEAQRDAVRVLARSLVSATLRLENGDLKDKASDDVSRKSLHDSIENTIQSLKPLLELQNLQ